MFSFLLEKVCQLLMSNSYSLDDLRTELEREYAPLQLEIGNKTVTLQNLMRLSRDNRAKVLAELEIVQNSNTESAEGIDTVLTSIKNLLTIVAGSEADGKALTNAIGEDLALAMKIIRLWSEATQAGEAQNSPG